ncbi:MAG TPA: TIGR00159 family protein [Desulfarculaceae bacterium]|nr:TIGR00159 family protein [Desulfarculaceae bacterium]
MRSTIANVKIMLNSTITVFFETLINSRWLDFLDIIIVAVLIYQVLVIIRDTRAFQILLGLFLIFITYQFSLLLGFYTLHWILNGFLSSIVIIVIVLFQNEFRRALAKFGKTSFVLNPAEELNYLDKVIKACTTMSLKRIGALIVFTRENKLPVIAEGGVEINAVVSDALILSIFNPTAPIHDGAIIIDHGRIVAAGCFLPLAIEPMIDKVYGTRHRAAMGISEDTDAVVVVVSEETGKISLSIGGKITKEQNPESLGRILNKLFTSQRNKSGLIKSLQNVFRNGT